MFMIFRFQDSNKMLIWQYRQYEQFVSDEGNERENFAADSGEGIQAWCQKRAQNTVCGRGAVRRRGCG